MTKDVALSTIKTAYSRWAPVYDRLYSRILRAGQRAAVEAATRAGTRILEIGCGTGLTLPDYPADKRVIGIDLSIDMLRLAKSKVKLSQLEAVSGLAVMDACRLGFADSTFDAVVGQYVITLVPDAEGALDEFARVLAPGGEIVLVNHIGARSGPMAWFEKAVAPLSKRLGWRSEFPLHRIETWANGAGFDLVEVREIGWIGFFTLMRLKRKAA